MTNISNISNIDNIDNISNVFQSHSNWPSVVYVCDRLAKEGFIAWLAGGCVRDALLNIVPHDFDIATNATPQEVQQIFQKSKAVGKHFGVILVYQDGVAIEVATFRKDGIYLDGRHPDQVFFTDAKEDAYRRDFTVNALFLDPITFEIHDFVDGQKDIKEQILRTVGDPEKRFDEDKLRLLRAIRFSAQLDFSLNDETYETLKSMINKVDCVSKERVLQEIEKLFLAKRCLRGFSLAQSIGLLSDLFPELDEDFESILNTKIFFSVLPNTMSVEGYWSVFWFFTYLNNPQTMYSIVARMRILKISKNLEKNICSILEALREAWLGNFHKSSFITIYASSVGITVVCLLNAAINVFPQLLNDWSASYQVLSKRFGFKRILPTPWISGSELQRRGWHPQKFWGYIIEEAYNKQLEEIFESPNEAFEWAENLLKKNINS